MSILMNSALYKIFKYPDSIIIKTSRSAVSIKIKVGTNGDFTTLLNENSFDNADPYERAAFIEGILRDALVFGRGFESPSTQESGESGEIEEPKVVQDTSVLSEDRIQKIISEIKEGRR